MALHPGSLATIPALRDYLQLKGKDRDGALEIALGQASEDIEGEGLGGRRGVYRGPVESYTSVAAAQSIKTRFEAPNNGAISIAGAPDSTGRTLVVRKVDADRSITAGTLTVSQASPALTETFNLADGDELHGVKFFTATVTATLSGCVGYALEDTIEIGTSEGYTEFYSPCGTEAAIVPIEWPLLYVAAIHEDYNQLYGSDTLLVAGTDYALRNRDSCLRQIVRLSSGLATPWMAGDRAVRGRLSAGWIGTAGVPPSVRGVCLELAAWYYMHADGKEFGLQSRTYEAGTVVRSGAPMLTEGMLRRLSREWRPDARPTAERGWSEFAA